MKKRRRFTPEFKAQIVLEVLTGAQSPAEVCRRHALGPNLLTTWKATVLQRLHTLFQGDEQHDEDQARIAELEQLLGRATRQIEVLKKQRSSTELGCRRFAIAPLHLVKQCRPLLLRSRLLHDLAAVNA